MLSPRRGRKKKNKTRKEVSLCQNAARDSGILSVRLANLKSIIPTGTNIRVYSTTSNSTTSLAAIRVMVLTGKHPIFGAVMLAAWLANALLYYVHRSVCTRGWSGSALARCAPAVRRKEPSGMACAKLSSSNSRSSLVRLCLTARSLHRRGVLPFCRCPARGSLLQARLLPYRGHCVASVRTTPPPRRPLGAAGAAWSSFTLLRVMGHSLPRRVV